MAEPKHKIKLFPVRLLLHTVYDIPLPRNRKFGIGHELFSPLPEEHGMLNGDGHQFRSAVGHNSLTPDMVEIPLLDKHPIIDEFPMRAHTYASLTGT